MNSDDTDLTHSNAKKQFQENLTLEVGESEETDQHLEMGLGKIIEFLQAECPDTANLIGSAIPRIRCATSNPILVSYVAKGVLPYRYNQGRRKKPLYQR